MSAVLTAAWALVQFATAPQLWHTGVANLVSAVAFALIPLLHRFGELVAPLVFTAFAYASIFIICWDLGTDSGMQFYFLVAACLVLLVLGIEHAVLAAALAAIGAGLTIALEFSVPADTGLAPDWVFHLGFVVSTITASAMVVAAVWYALREIARAEAAMEREYQRSESLLSNILPTSVAARLKDPARTLIADKYDEASILFADIAGYTTRASDITPGELVRFLDRLYTEFDRLVDKHGLEKIKTSGDSYMVVSGVPHPRRDHDAALASFALDMAETVAGLKDPSGRPVPLRIGLGCGPVVAGVVGARKFFYDVWGDAVNVASRMESTDAEGRIQVPQDVYDRLKDDFVFEERGDVDVKGKGVMHTWYLVGRRAAASDQTLASSSSSVSADVT
ncbi:MAG: adenylate/guanylate cyclase domain-containing protein [Mycobacteriaceae bacterium]|nr:adenylate/guanylate cyclase domain-containing protein [Mycobacteriaceae bacterium]